MTEETYDNISEIKMKSESKVESVKQKSEPKVKKDEKKKKVKVENDKKKKKSGKDEKPKPEKEIKIEKPEPKPDKVSKIEKPKNDRNLDLIFFEMIPERPVLKPRETIEVNFKNTGGFRIEMVISLYSLRMRLQNAQICDNNSTVHRVVEPGATTSVLIKDTGVYCGYKSDWVPFYDPERRDGQLTLEMASVDATVKEMRPEEYMRVCDREKFGYGCTKHIVLKTSYEVRKNPKKNVGLWTLDYTTFVTMEPESKSYKEQLERIKLRTGYIDADEEGEFALHMRPPLDYVWPRTEESMKKRLEKRIAEENQRYSITYASNQNSRSGMGATEAEELSDERKKRKKKRCTIS